MHYGLTNLGIFHTIISFIALFAGVLALIRDGKITGYNFVGKVYIISTVIICVTGFGIFQHGGFGKPHQLAIITLLVLIVAFAAAVRKLGRLSPYIETVCYSLTFFFQIVPTVTEGMTRLPYGAPLASSPDDPRIQMWIGISFILFLIGATIQVRKMKKNIA